MIRRVGRWLAALLALLALAAWAGGAPLSLAQGGRFDVGYVTALQVIQNAPLVVGKATVVRVVVTASSAGQATVEATLGSSTRQMQVNLAKGGNNVYVPVDPPAAPGTMPVSARVLSGGRLAGAELSGSVEAVALQRDHLSALYLPVDWTEQDRNTYFARFYNSFVAATGDFLKATYPLASVNVGLNSSSNTFMLTPSQRAIGDAQGNIDFSALVDMYSSIVAAGEQVAPGTDLVVGVLPPKWFARNLHDASVVGLEFHSVRGAVISQVDADYATLAHETGHVFGRSDDYDFSVSPEKIGNTIDQPGYWVDHGQAVPPAARTFSFMGASDARSSYWVDSDTYITILRELQDGFDLGQ